MNRFHVRGADHPNSKLTAAKVRRIRRMHSEGIGYDRLAARFGVNKVTIQRVVLRRSWAHLEANEDRRTA